MSPFWLLPASVTLASVLVLCASLRRVAHEARQLRQSLAACDRLAVAVGDLAHEARATELGLRRLTHR